MIRYCVIGAGAAGLSALYELRQAGYDVDCFEKSDRVGGHWNTDYDALHLITSRDMTHFSDFPMPLDYPQFPRKDQVRDYIASFAERRGLNEQITFGTSVESVVPIPCDGPTGSAGWRVSLADGSVRDYEGVLVANGHLQEPKIPEVPGSFTGKQIHSGDYQNTGDLEDGRVLVVGAGNSGCDLAVDAAQHRFDVDIVIREGVYFQPKSYFGVPRQEVSWLKEFSPSEQDLISRLLAKASIGEWHNYPGMPEPAHKTLAEGRTVVNSLLLHWIQHGRVFVVPGIERFEDKTVYFQDGTSREYDTILWATGFHASVPFLPASLLERRGGVPLRLGGGIVPLGLEKLYFIGLTAPRGPQIPIYGEQARVVVKMIDMHRNASGGYVPLSAYLARFQEAEDRIDIVRNTWVDQMRDTWRLVESYEHATKASAIDKRD